MLIASLAPLRNGASSGSLGGLLGRLWAIILAVIGSCCWCCRTRKAKGKGKGKGKGNEMEATRGGIIRRVKNYLTTNALNFLGEVHLRALESMVRAFSIFVKNLKEKGISILDSLRRSPMLNFGAILVYTQIKYPVPPTSDKKYDGKDVLFKAARYVQFANAAYAVKEKDFKEADDQEESKEADDQEERKEDDQKESKEAKIAGRIFGLEAKDVLHVYVHKSGVYCPDFFIAYDQDTNAIVLSIRGTVSIQDVMTDLTCNAKDFLDGKAHAGMLNSSETLMGKAAPILRDLIVEHPTRKLVVVGHSLGAGVAILATLRLCSEQPSIIAASTEFQCFAFAPPPVFGPPDKLPPKASSCIYSFVNHVDGIPRTSALSIARLMKTVAYVDSLSDADVLALLGGKALSSGSTDFPDDIPLDTSTKKLLLDCFGNLSVVGKTLLLYGDENGQPRCDEVGDKASPDVLKKFLPLPAAFSAHTIGSYENIVINVGLPPPGYGPQDRDEVKDLASGRPYFFNRSTGETSWAPPPPLR